MEHQTNRENKQRSFKRRDDESSVRFVTAETSSKSIFPPMKPLTLIPSSIFRERNSDSEAENFVPPALVSTTRHRHLMPSPPTVSVLDATAETIYNRASCEGTSSYDIAETKKAISNNNVTRQIELTPRIVGLPKKKKPRTARTADLSQIWASSSGSILNDKHSSLANGLLHITSSPVITHQLPQMMQNPLKTPSCAQSLPHQTPCLSLSAFRKPEAAVRLTDADPERSIQNFYNIYGMQSRVLGHGASSIVRLATRQSNGSKVAIKSIAKHDILFSRRGRQRFHRKRMLDEWELLLALRGDPHVVGMLDVFETDQDVHLVLEYCAGGELFDAIQSKKQESKRGSGYTEAQAAQIISQLLSALGTLHRRGIVHRDVKPENVLLVSDEAEDLQVKLSDFGLARVLRSSFVAQSVSNFDFSSDSSSSDDSSCEDSHISYPPVLCLRAYSCVGSDTYVAPEVMAGSGYDTAVDIYSLGVTLYILLCGFSPDLPDFKDEDEDDVKSLNKGGRVDLSSSIWNSISDQAKDLVKRMMEPDPSMRLTAEEALKHEWFMKKHNCVAVHGPAHGQCTHKNFKSGVFHDKMTCGHTRRRKRQLSICKPICDSNKFKLLRNDASKSPPSSLANMSKGFNCPFSGAMALSMAELYSRMSQIAADTNAAAPGLIDSDDDNKVDIVDHDDATFGTVLAPFSV